MFNNIFQKRGKNQAKRAELSINMIIVAILAIVVLVVVIFIFTKGTKDAAKGYTSITSSALEARCEGFLGANGICRSTCASDEEPTSKPKDTTKWIDCDEKNMINCCKPKSEPPKP